MPSVSGNIAANARAASLSAKVMAKRRSPTVIHIRDSSAFTAAVAASRPSSKLSLRISRQPRTRRWSLSTARDLNRLAAIDHHGVPDNESGRVRAQPDDGRADLLWLSHAPDRLLRDHRLSSLGGSAAEAIHHRRVDDSRAHGVDTNFRRGIVK